MTGRSSARNWKIFSKKMIKLSIVIVSYNTKELLLQCLQSVKKAIKGLDNREIIVVDNGSTDGTVEEIRKSKLGIRNLFLIRNKQNLGFAAGNNIGIKRAQGKFILLLNSDTLVFPKTLVSMYQYMDTHPEVGVATCRVEFPDGQLDPACHRGFPTPWASLTYFLGLEKLFPKTKLFGQYHLGFLPMDLLHEIDSPTGAFYLVRREVIDEVGFLDEDYFIYGEDLDWSYRIKQAGWKIIYYPYVKIVHLKKSSGRESGDKKLRREITSYFYETMKTFYKKHYLNKYPRFITTLIFLAIDIKKQTEKMIIDTHVRGR